MSSKATISGWSHGKIRAYIEYKAQTEGIRVVLQDEPLAYARANLSTVRASA